jgi:hypothetical protein
VAIFAFKNPFGGGKIFQIKGFHPMAATSVAKSCRIM